MNEHRCLAVPDGLEGERLDAALSRIFGLSRTRAAELVAAGHVRLDGGAAAKSDRVRGGAWLDVSLPASPPPAAPPAAQVPGLEIRYEDRDVVVVDKPVGVAAHPSPGWDGPTVSSGLLAVGHRVAASGAPERQGIVHRLDVGTSGLMVVAKSEQAYGTLKRAFRERRVTKRYHALVQGHPNPLRGTVDAPLGRHPTQQHRWAVVSDGKPSVTRYDIVEAFRAAALLEIHPETGRTHQIRAHMAAIHHPCVGDHLYGADPTLSEHLGLERQWLHAVELGFEHPVVGGWIEVTSDYTQDLDRALAILRAET